jgi:probable rRNA maturation factor
MVESFTLLNTTKGKLPRLPFREMKEAVLGTDYELSLVFVDEKESHRVNLETRGKDKPTNILSFPLDKNSGEIIICPTYAEKEAPNFERTYENYMAFLFIHGLVHLKGFDHGSRMESEEKKFRTLFTI